MADRRYYFSLGSGTAGAMSLCAAVLAQSKAQAQDRLKTALRPFDDKALKVFDDLCATPDPEAPPGLEYIRVYFNSDAISRAVIYEQGEVRDKEEAD